MVIDTTIPNDDICNIIDHVRSDSVIRTCTILDIGTVPMIGQVVKMHGSSYVACDWVMDRDLNFRQEFLRLKNSKSLTLWQRFKNWIGA